MGSNPIQIANASVAQSVEQGTENPRVIGSIPIGGTKEYVVLSAEADEEAAYSFLADLAHLVERHLAKVEVASSSLVARSRVKQDTQLWVSCFFIRKRTRCLRPAPKARLDQR